MENSLSIAAREICAHGPVVPVIVLEDASHSKPLGQALIDGGVRVLEITLRTKAALDAIAEAATLPDAVVGAGTVLSKADMINAKAVQTLLNTKR